LEDPVVSVKRSPGSSGTGGKRLGVRVHDLVGERDDFIDILLKGRGKKFGAQETGVKGA